MGIHIGARWIAVGSVFISWRNHGVFTKYRYFENYTNTFFSIKTIVFRFRFDWVRLPGVQLSAVFYRFIYPHALQKRSHSMNHRMLSSQTHTCLNNVFASEKHNYGSAWYQIEQEKIYIVLDRSIWTDVCLHPFCRWIYGYRQESRWHVVIKGAWYVLLSEIREP